MSNKKGKKSKGKTMPLQDFLGDTPVAITPIPKINSWADDEEDDFSFMTRPKDPVSLPTAPRAARDASFNEEIVPTNPPYVAYISNLPYDVEEEDLYEFFVDMKVSSMRLPKDANKFKGYGYVEFEDRQSLIDAMSMVDTTLKTRRVRIEVSNSSNDDRRGGRMGRMGDSRREYSPERTGGDWRTARSDDGPRDDDRDGERGGDRGGYRSRGGFERRDDIRSERDSGFDDSKPGNWRDAPRESFDRPRPSFREVRDRPGPPGEDRDRGMGGRFSDRSGPRGMRDNRDGSRERDNERSGGFGPRRYNSDDMDREKDRWSSVRSQPREPVESRESRAPAESSSAPMTRPKLELKPRTKPIEPIVVAKSEEPEENDGESAENDAPAAAPPAKPAANIFGSARPVDTAAREREIEERLAKTAEASRTKEESGDGEKRAPREGVWNRRNGEGQGRFEDRPSRPTWRSRPVDGNDQRENQNNRDSRFVRDSRDSRDTRSGSRGSSANRGGRPQSRGPTKQVDNRSPPDGEEKDKKRVELTEEEEIKRMPKAKDDHGPNIVSSNKYSMLPDDVDPDNIEE